LSVERDSKADKVEDDLGMAGETPWPQVMGGFACGIPKYLAPDLGPGAGEKVSMNETSGIRRSCPAGSGKAPPPGPTPILTGNSNPRRLSNDSVILN
jgi:hypothetical protein